MSGSSSLHSVPPSTSIYESPSRIRKKLSSSSSLFESEEDPNVPEEVEESESIEAELYRTKPTTPSFSQSNTFLNSPTAGKSTFLTPSQQYSSMVRQPSANIHSIFNKLNTLNEKTKHEDKRSFLHSIKGHMRKSSKDKFNSLFDPTDGSPLNDTWRGSPLQPFSVDDIHRSPTPSPHSPLKSPTISSYPSFTKLPSHSKRRLTSDNTVEEIAREMEQYYVQNNQRIESYMDQIALLEKQKRDLVLESKQWKKKWIHAENRLHSQEMEHQEGIRNLNENHQKNLDGIKGIHRKKCKQYGEVIKKLMATNEAFRAQLQESGIAPATITSEAGSLVETQEWADDHAFIKKKMAAIERRKRSLQLEEDMAAGIEYITLALGVELRQVQVDKYQEITEHASQSPPVSSTTPVMKKSPRRRSALRGKRADNYFSLRIENSPKNNSEKLPSIYHKTDHRQMKETLQPEQLSDIDTPSDESSSIDGNHPSFRFITMTRGSASKYTQNNLNVLSRQSSKTSLSTTEATDQEDSTPLFRFKVVDCVPDPSSQCSDEEGNVGTADDNLSSTDADSQVDEALSTPLPHEETPSSISHNSEEANSLTKPVISNPTFNSPSRVSPRLSVFAKTRNPTFSQSPSPRTANRLSTQSSFSTDSSNLYNTPTRESSYQLQHTPALRRKPLPKVPEINTSIAEESKVRPETL
ncbi:hypothetical protein K7432_011810 [Basidiobolus ranarum]|uniref:Uncharacterized protein n=1 Tax=Basidiobolus ranarum TaxID=34480 RepID=A0ABR2VT96_9FUNG